MQNKTTHSSHGVGTINAHYINHTRFAAISTFTTKKIGESVGRYIVNHTTCDKYNITE